MPWHIEIFVPRTPCSCSPHMVIEPDLIRFQEGLIALRKQYGNDLSCSVYALNQNLTEFRRYPELVRILQEIGEKGLPAIFINGELALSGEYPEIAQFENLLEKSGK
jgi:hypothetical protein